jgi:hypothetical protein
VFKAIEDIIIETEDGEVKIPKDTEFEVLYNEEEKTYSIVGEDEEDTIHFSEETADDFFGLVDTLEEDDAVTEDEVDALEMLINSDASAFDITEGFCKKKLSESILTRAGKKIVAGKLKKGMSLKGLTKAQKLRVGLSKMRHELGE